ncbi:MAG: M15 family metallopeptidase [Defluviitaleaceae bacterium]|nr:M15 family metallopeptidase [Defluviitaleaceae bacterium]
MKPIFAMILMLSVVLLNIITVQGSGVLWLVNKDNPLPADFHPVDLVEYRHVKLSQPAKDAFIKMLSAMESEGVTGLRLQSAYRTHEHQSTIFNRKVASLTAQGKAYEIAIEEASHTVQPPGASEHQLGLALDVSINGELSQKFADTPAGQWLEENCHRFGFIIRYPLTKTEITNIVYEPWHLRYIGIPHATILYEENLTLEEYHHYLSSIFMYIVWGDSDDYYLISYSDVFPDNLDVDAEVFETHPQSGYGYVIIQHKIQDTEI